MIVAGMNIQLPETWFWSKCGNVIDVRDGTHETPQYQSEGYPLITSKNLKPEGIDFQTVSYISKEDHKEISKRSKVERGDILFAMIGTIGNPVLVETDVEFSIKNVALFKFLGSRIDARYFKYLLSTSIIKRQIISEQRGGTQKFVSLKVLRNMLIPYPPLEEQKRIAAILDRAEAVRRKRQAAIQLTEELLRSTFLKMFGHPVKNSKNWPTRPLGDLSAVNRGKFTPRPRNDPQFYNGKFPFIQTGDIAAANGYLTKYSQTLNEKGIKVSRSFQAGNIVIAIVGATIGETAILTEERYCPDSIIGIELNHSLCPEYVEYLLRFGLWTIKNVLRPSGSKYKVKNLQVDD